MVDSTEMGGILLFAVRRYHVADISMFRQTDHRGPGRPTVAVREVRGNARPATSVEARPRAGRDQGSTGVGMVAGPASALSPAPRAGSLNLLEDALAELGPRLPEDVAVDVRVAEHAVRVDLLEHAHEVVEVLVPLAEFLRAEGVRLRPVRPAPVADEDLLKAREQLLVGHIQSVRPVARGVPMDRARGDGAKGQVGWQCRKTKRGGRKRDAKERSQREIPRHETCGNKRSGRNDGAAMAQDDTRQGRKECEKKDQKQAHNDAELEKHALVLNDPYPTRPLAVTRAQPDVVLIRESDFQRAVGPQAGGVSELPLQPVSQFGETQPGVLVGYCPLGRVLRILFAAAMRTQKHRSATGHLDT